MKNAQAPMSMLAPSKSTEKTQKNMFSTLSQKLNAWLQAHDRKELERQLGQCADLTELEAVQRRIARGGL